MLFLLLIIAFTSAQQNYVVHYTFDSDNCTYEDPATVTTYAIAVCQIDESVFWSCSDKITTALYFNSYMCSEYIYQEQIYNNVCLSEVDFSSVYSCDDSDIIIPSSPYISTKYYIGDACVGTPMKQTIEKIGCRYRLKPTIIKIDGSVYIEHAIYSTDDCVGDMKIIDRNPLNSCIYLAYQHMSIYYTASANAPITVQSSSPQRDEILWIMGLFIILLI
jgi:hypothetical protein